MGNNPEEQNRNNRTSRSIILISNESKKMGEKQFNGGLPKVCYKTKVGMTTVKDLFLRVETDTVT